MCRLIAEQPSCFKIPHTRTQIDTLTLTLTHLNLKTRKHTFV